MSTRTTLKVAGMHCDGCERSISNALARIDGVTSVDADFQTGVVEVSLDTEVDRATLEGAIEDAGYDVLPDDKRPLPLV